MDNNQNQIDLDTLAEVHRILSTTEFATIDDVVARGGLSTPIRPDEAAAVAGPAGGSAPLPRRR